MISRKGIRTWSMKALNPRKERREGQEENCKGGWRYKKGRK